MNTERNDYIEVIAIGAGRNISHYLLILFFFSSVQCNIIEAQNKSWLIGNIPMIDGAVSPYNNVMPGDTLFLKAGTRDKLIISNLYGTEAKPIIIINIGGTVIISTEGRYGISVRNCRYFRLSGQGDEKEFYGIKIIRVADGAGIGIGDMSSDYEIDHISIENSPIAGLFAKTDPGCSYNTTREKFTQYNTRIHDNYIANVGNEGMYIGSSKYSGQTFKCDGKDTVLFPSVLKGVRVYNNIVKYTGWDGIQVSSASEDCQVYGNTVFYDSQAEEKNQMSGIIIGGGSKCDCYNNLISQGKGIGIESHGLGGYSIYNNIIIDAGRSFYPDDETRIKHGIFVSDASALSGASFNILYNDIINPKSDGIRFQSEISKKNLIASNLIVNPGSFNLYENDNTSLTGDDSFIMLPNNGIDVILQNNFLTRDIKDAMISESDYSILPGSPLIDAGYVNSTVINFDFNNHRRPSGQYNDIGAIEYDPDDTDPGLTNQIHLYPNPVRSVLSIRFSSGLYESSVIDLHDLNGKILDKKDYISIRPGEQELQVDTSDLPSGIYLISIRTGSDLKFGKFIKVK
jgi:hypothetical protein